MAEENQEPNWTAIEVVIEIKHVKGEENIEADALSRSPAVNLLNIDNIKEPQNEHPDGNFRTDQVKMKVRQELRKIYPPQFLRTNTEGPLRVQSHRDK